MDQEAQEVQGRMKRLLPLIVMIPGCAIFNPSPVMLTYRVTDPDSGVLKEITWQRPAVANVSFGEVDISKDADGSIGVNISDYSFEQQMTKAMQQMADTMQQLMSVVITKMVAAPAPPEDDG